MSAVIALFVNPVQVLSRLMSVFGDSSAQGTRQHRSDRSTIFKYFNATAYPEYTIQTMLHMLLGRYRKGTIEPILALCLSVPRIIAYTPFPLLAMSNTPYSYLKKECVSYE
jgi:hypothetical protein